MSYLQTSSPILHALKGKRAILIHHINTRVWRPFSSAAADIKLHKNRWRNKNYPFAQNRNNAKLSEAPERAIIFLV